MHVPKKVTGALAFSRTIHERAELALLAEFQLHKFGQLWGRGGPSLRHPGWGCHACRRGSRETHVGGDGRVCARAYYVQSI